MKVGAARASNPLIGRAVDVFYVTDLIGAKIDQPSRQAAIKRTLIQLLGPAQDAPRAVRAAG